MEAGDRDALEEAVRRKCQARDFAGAATDAVRGYGPEIFSLVASLHRDEDTAADLFSAFTESLWRGLPSFRWDCSLRTWAYTLARHTSQGHLRGARRRGRAVAATDSSIAGQLAVEVRSRTRTSMRTETKNKFAELRQSLPEEEQTLLVLRVDRDMAWSDLAHVMLGRADASPAELTREAARLRKRFQLLKEKLTVLAREAGLTASDG